MLSFITVNKMENNLKKVINNMCAGRAVLKKGSGSGSGRIAAEVLPAMNDSKKKKIYGMFTIIIFLDLILMTRILL